MPPARFEPTIPASERPQTHTLERAATGIGPLHCPPKNIHLDPVRYIHVTLSLVMRSRYQLRKYTTNR